MKMTKRLVAVALAILMIFGSVSVAMTASAADGTTLGITTKFLRNVNGVWTETSKVKLGEEVKLGVYLDTDFYAGDGEILLFYDNTFFEPVSTGDFQTLTVGSFYGTGSSYGIGGNGTYCHIGPGSQAATYSQAMLDKGKIDSAFASTHDPLYIAFAFGESASVQKFDGSKLFCEIPFKVKADTSAVSGQAEAVEATACSPDFRRGRINVSRGEEGTIASNADNMWNWEADFDFEEEPVSLFENLTSATFDAKEGRFKVSDSKYVTSLYSEGEAGEGIVNLVGKDTSNNNYLVKDIIEPVRDGYNFLGWKVQNTDDSTATDVVVYPASNTTYEAVWEKIDLGDADGLKFRTEIYRLDENGEWVFTEKVMPGENVKARLFVDTEYNAGNGEILLFYDGDFFEDAYPTDTQIINFTINDFYKDTYGITGKAYKPTFKNNTIVHLIESGYFDVKYLNDHPAFVVTYEFPISSDCHVLTGDEWLVEFDLKVKDSEKLADTVGDFYINEDTIQDTEERYTAFVNIARETENSSLAIDADSMNMWDADVTVESNPVSIYNTIRFDANEGEFNAENKETFTIDGTVGEKIDYSTVPVPTREGYTFMGWIDSADTTPTLGEAKKAEQLAADEKTATMTHKSIIEDSDPAAAIIYNAFWVSNVDVSFAVVNPETGAAEVFETRNVALGDPLEAPAEIPELDGYRFMGWTDTYPDGTNFKFIDLPEKYPSESTTYYAVYSAQQYIVNYYVIDADDEPVMDNFKLVAQAKTEYGAPIAATPHTYTAPEGYAMSVAYDEVLYGEEVMFIDAGKFIAGTTMPASEYNLYFKIERAEFDAIFDANGGAWADGETSKTVKAVYEDEIAAPEAPEYAGYVFMGWEPDVTIMDEEGKSFKAVWAPDTFIATYHIDSESYPYDVDFGDEMQYPADPYKEGHNFLGWAEEENSTAVVELPATMPAENKDYYAVFEAIEYTITFENTAETTMADITLPYGTEIGEIAEPVKTGYTFTGWTWTKDDVDKTPVAAPTTMPAYNTIASAKWEINQYTVTWNVEGVETEVKYDYLAPIEKAANPVKTGHTFEGWTPEFPEEGLVMPAEDLTFTAVFTANTYDAVFNTVADGETHDGRFDSDDSTSFTAPTVFGEEIVAPAEVPVRTGYTFAGWDPIVGTMDEEGKTYTAEWNANTNTKYTVEFYSMKTDGTYELSDTQERTGTSDSVIDLVVSAPYNYTINADLSTYDDDGVTIAPDGSTVVTVYFELNKFVVTFVGNEGTVDGEAEVSKELRYGAQVTVPATEREGYTFKGWFDAAEGGNALDVNLTAVKTVTYYAQWEINQYTITFDTVGGTEIPAKTQDYGTAVEAPAAPTKLGHTFVDWDKAIPATMPAEDMTITAQWTVNSYDAIFNAGEGKFADDAKTKTVEDVEFGKDITAPAENPTREGYDFIGWSTDGETVLTPVGIMDAEGKEFKAVWEINKYTITFADTGDTVIAPITKDYGEAVEAPADPVKEGYTFTSWDVAVPATMPATDMTITAQWTVNSYDATFDAGEGAAFPSDGEQTETTPVNYDDAIVAPDEAPEKTGYDFAGWKDSEGNIIQPGETADKKMDADGEGFTAEWTPAATDFTVIVKDVDTDAVLKEELITGTTDNAIEVVESIPDPAVDNTDYVLLDDVAVKGYHLYKNAANDLTGKKVAPDGSTVVTLYYEVDEYTVVYDANGGTYADGSDEISLVLPYGASTSANAPIAPTKEGSTFNKWLGSPTVTGNGITMIADWTLNEYTINWDTNGDWDFEADDNSSKIDFTQTAKYGELVNKQTNAVKEGYTFAGWVDEKGAKVTALPDTIPAKNLTIIAKYEVESFTINFNSDGGSAVDPITQDYGTAIKAPAEPTKEGYDFAGWSPELPATMPDLGDTGASTTVTAQWTKNNYTVTYFVKNPATGAFDEITTATVAYKDPISTVFAYTAPDGYSLVNVAYTDTGLTAPLAADAKMPANNVNLYFDVAANEYEAKFYLDDAKTDLYATVKADYNAVIDAPAAPSLDGYEFAGWTPAVDTMSEVGGMEFVAQWTPKKYKVTYNANGGEMTIEGKVETIQIIPDVAYGTAVPAAAAEPTRTGYTFDGWEGYTDGMTMPAKDIVLTAKWKVNQGKVTFKDGDKVITTLTQDYGTAVTAPDAPTKEGHTFTGWDANVPATMPDAEIEINATWKKNTYTVTWIVDGNQTVAKYEFGDAIVKPADPEKAGYTFGGWTPDVLATMPAEDQIYTATWTAKNITVTFDAAGGTGAWGENGAVLDKVTVTAKCGEALKAPADPSREGGYTFGGWNPAVPATMPTVDTTYTATWITAAEVTYTVVSHYMDTAGDYTDSEEEGTLVKSTGLAAPNTMITVSTAAPEGFAFDSSNVNNVIKGVVTADGFAEFHVYYARDSYTITFDGNGGTIDSNPSGNYLYGSTVVEPTPVRTGYDFTGWADAAENGNAVVVNTTATGDATYYAQWKEATYTATFKANDGKDVTDAKFENGESTETTEYTYGDESGIKEPANVPVRDGYTFDKWVDENGKTPAELGTEVAEDTTFTATWTPNQYTVTYYLDSTKAYVVYTTTAAYLQEYNVPVADKEGHKFLDWVDASTGASAGLTAGGLTTIPVDGAEYYATWTVNKVNLVYRANGGTFEDGSANKTYPVDYGTAKADMPVPAEPTREGYSFNGYSPALPETMPATQLNLVAQWTPKEYDVTFDAGEGAFTQGTEDTSDDTPTFTDKVIYEKQPVYVPDEVPVRPGYDFGGWEDEEGNVYNSGDEIPMTAGNVKLDAIWTAADSEYTVLHYYMDVNGTYEDAEIITEDVTDKTDTKVTVIPRNMDNFTFDAAASTVEGTVTADGALVLELYYVREKNTFTTYDEDGNEVTSEEVYFDAPLNVADPTKEGYTFAGWTDAEGNPVTVPATMPADKLDIYESWTIKSFDVIFDANTGAWADGDTVKTVSTNYGADIDAYATEPKKLGHTFEGWYDTAATTGGRHIDTYTTMPELADGETITFYARWTADTKDYKIEIYQMNPDGTMPTEPTSMVINNALVGEEIVIKEGEDLTVPAGFTIDTEKSVLSGTVPEGEDETLVLKVVLVRAPYKFTAIVDDVAVVDGVEYYYDETVEVIDTPVKDGYTFAGWTTTDPGAEGGYIDQGDVVDAKYPARMPNNDVTIYGVWSTNSYNATFDAGKGMFENGTEDPADDKPVVTVPVKFGETVTVPSEVPVQEGFEFGGWKAEDGTVYQPGEEIPDEMTSAGATFEAVWNKSNFTVTFYGYEALAESPYKSERATKVLDSKNYDYTETIDFPEVPTNIDAKYYEFLGWSATEGGAIIPTEELNEQKMPASDTAFYAVYKRVKVELIPNDDAAYWSSEKAIEKGHTCTTVIDRTGDNWYVYGLVPFMRVEVSESQGLYDIDNYIDVSGDGYYEVVDFKAKEGSVGTGTVIKVYDNVTKELVETFTIIIYGDLNGDGQINNTDYSIAYTESNQSTSWSVSYSDEYCHYKAKAADVNASGNFDGTDSTLINYYPLGSVGIDQVAGCVTKPSSLVITG